MSDGIEVTPGTGPKIATDEVVRNGSQEHQQVIKVSLGAEGQFGSLLDSGQKVSAQSIPVVLSSDHPEIKVQRVVEISYKTIIDKQGSITYAGRAAPGSPTNLAVWQISKFDETANPATVTWADGGTFDQVWDNRVSLLYI